MRTRLILIEGIPGSGKTTIAGKTRDELCARGVDTALYTEGQAHPADLSWCAYLSCNEYEDLLARYPEQAPSLARHTLVEGTHAVIPYSRMGLDGRSELLQYLQQREIFDGRVDAEVFCELHLRRWHAFAQRAVPVNSVTIFECVLLQSHICELMGIHNLETDAIAHHLRALVRAVLPLKPVIIYLSQPDVRQTIERVARERLSHDKRSCPDWIDMAIAWVEKSAWARCRGLSGFEGLVAFMEARKQLELHVLPQFPCVVHVVDNPDCAWDDVFAQVRTILATHFPPQAAMADTSVSP